MSEYRQAPNCRIEVYGLQLKRALLLTAKDTETKAVKQYFGKPKRFVRTSRGNRVSVWEWQPDTLAPMFEIAIYEAGKGQAETIIATGSLVESYQPDLVVYLGCAGGDPEHTRIGDVFVGTHIWNYERASETADTVRSKSHPICPDRVFLDEARGVADFDVWKAKLLNENGSTARVVFGEIASGEKVIKSTEAKTWQHIKSSVSDDITACETEGHGFLSALVPLKAYGIMVRGISDHLSGKDANGKAVDDANQTHAVQTATAFTLQLIEDIDHEALRNVKFLNNNASSSTPADSSNVLQFSDPDFLRGDALAYAMKRFKARIDQGFDAGAINSLSDLYRLVDGEKDA